MSPYLTFPPIDCVPLRHLRIVLVPLLCVFVMVSSGARAADLQLLPGSARLEGPTARQRFLVEVNDQGRWVSDRTAQAHFAIDNPRVAHVSADGTVTPTGNGLATLSAAVEGKTVRASISVEEFER